MLVAMQIIKMNAKNQEGSSLWHNIVGVWRRVIEYETYTVYEHR